MTKRIEQIFFKPLAILLSLFILAEVNYPRLSPQSELAIFAMLGLILIFLKFPLAPKLRESAVAGIVDAILILATLFCFGYVVVHSEPIFSGWWISGEPLGNRAGMEQTSDFIIGLLGVGLVLEATRRSIGLTLPLLSILFLLYAAVGPNMPDWLFPHRGYPWQRIVSQTFLHSQGVFGIALNVMFTYVFLFVLFGTLLEKTGAIDYIITLSRRMFRNSVGGPAKVAVLSSGLMGSLSGSAVANTATTGTFTIPMMRSSGFRPAIAAGVEAAASSGGALVPPIMGAGAYMMLEIINPPVTYLQIIKSAMIPAILYYTALLLIVHFQAKRAGSSTGVIVDKNIEKPHPFQGIVFLGAFVTLILFLVIGYTPFRAVSISLAAIVLISAFHKKTRIGVKSTTAAMSDAAHGGVSLIAAASCVGLILGVVTLTGIGSKLPGTILPLAQNNLLLALLLIMVSTIILGMGLPSAVCYLLMATLIGPVLSDLGLVPLSAHLFIFYFGMMSMVTPPVALAAYTAAAIAGAGIMQSGFSAFRFALIGFVLPFAFVLHPELLLLSPDGSPAPFLPVLSNLLLTLLGLIPLAASVTGYWFTRIVLWKRIFLLTAAMTLILTTPEKAPVLQSLAAISVVLFGLWNWRMRERVLNASARDMADHKTT